MQVVTSDISLFSTRDHVHDIEHTIRERAWVGDQRPDFEAMEDKTSRGKRRVMLEQARSQVARFMNERLNISDEARAAGHRFNAVEEESTEPSSDSAARVSDTDALTSDGSFTDKDINAVRLLNQIAEKITGRQFSFIPLQSILNRFDTDNVQTPDFKDPIEENQTPEADEETRVGWGYEYDETYREYEAETTRFQASGVIKTNDGRTIDFSIELTMSREFLREQQTSIRAGDAALVDPLVINFDGVGAQLDAGKIEFDLNSDGTKESIHRLKAGSGVLVLDKDGDGKATDGSELFGPQSGNGFAELAAYDEDNNGFIDAGDSVYDQLQIWVQSAQETDRMMSLREAGVSAISTKSIATAFDLRGADNNALYGRIASTSVYVSENSNVGVVQQLDLAV